jgi:hypothetical protein
MTDGSQQTGIEPRRVIEALAAHEDAIGDLYAAYAVRFPKAASFWQGLSGEEYGHGSLMRDLGAHEHELDVFVDTRRFPLPELQAATRSVRDQIAVAEGSRVTLVEALETALDLEQQMIERDAYEVFSSDSPNVSRVLGHLHASSERHRDVIRDYLVKIAR